MLFTDFSHVATILDYYKDPDNVGMRDELERLDLLDKVEPYIETVKELTLQNFIKNDRWNGISKEMDEYLPSLICDGRVNEYGRINENKYSYIIRRNDVLRTINITSQDPIHELSIYANDFLCFKKKCTGRWKWTIDINSGIPTTLLSNCVIKVVTDVKLTSIQTVNTYLPNHIFTQLRDAKQVIVPTSQGNDFLINGEGCMIETL